MKKVLCACFVLALGTCFASTAWGQAQITTGTVQGDVLDEKGGSVAGASVEAKNLDTNFTQTETTNTDGHFAFLSLAPGRYTLTISKSGFATVLQQNVNLTVGQAINIPVTMKVSSVAQQIIVTDVPTVETTKTESSSTLNELTVSDTPVLGRKFEDLLTLTPGVAVTQGPDGDEINFNGQRGVFNNISLDGGDYNNGFFGEQLGGQRAAIDITLDAVKEFQVVASGANAEFGRTAGGVVNVITKSGTNEVHGTLFEYFRTEALTAATSDGKPLTDFNRNQFGGTIGGPIIKDKMFLFGAFEHIRSNLTRANLSAPIGTACAQSPNFDGTAATDALINSSPDCQRQALLNFMKSDVSQNDGLPVKHPIRNTAALGRFDWNLNAQNQLAVSYNFDYSKNENQTFDVPTYGNSANGIEGPSKINVINVNHFTTVSPTKLNEAHFSYQREIRPRSATASSIPADTAMGFVTTFRFGAPFFLEPNIDETIWRTQLRDNFSVVRGKHNFKFGGDWLHTNNSQVFRGFFTGRYIFDSVAGFLHYAAPSSSCAAGTACGPTVTECSDGTFVDASASCSGGATKNGGPLIFYLQDGIPTGAVSIKPGASSINNEDYALFAQDKWQIFPSFSLSYGLRWEGQIFPSPVVPPSQTAYGPYLSDPRFPSDGTLHSAKKEFQPRVGFAWDVRNNHKSVLRASYGIYYARQNMLTQVGSITTNGAQQFTAFCNSSFAFTCFGLAPNPPTWPGKLTVPAPGTIPPGAGVRVFSKHYENPRIYTTNVAYEQEILPNLSAYADFTMSKGVHLTTFWDATRGFFADDGSFVTLSPFPNLGGLMITASTAKSLYRGLTVGMRKRFSQRFQLEWNYVLSEDLDTDSNERDPFTDRRLDPLNPALDYSFSDRDERHKFNLFGYYELPGGFNFDTRLQAHTPQPITPADCLANLNCKRNSTWKNNEYISFDWRATRPFKFGDRYRLVPAVEMFNTFNNKNNVNPLVTPALFNFDGFLRVGVGDPRQAQLSVRFEF
jgi:carboxypeptidase family protein/TonB-dependent receptor-like protein